MWTLSGEQEKIAAWASEAGIAWREMPAHARCASLPELRNAGALEGMDFASHSWSHPNLAALDVHRVHEELSVSKEWLEAEGLRSCSFLAYPYGYETAAVRRVASACGYAGALKVVGGWTRRSDGRDPFALPRLNMPAGLTTRGFRLRLRRFL